jgi:hypothetical protein
MARKIENWELLERTLHEFLEKLGLVQTADQRNLRVRGESDNQREKIENLADPRIRNIRDQSENGVSESRKRAN